jgi:glycosyltransferase involved in cell wall biosynthesis
VVAGDGPQLQVLRRLAQEESPTAQPLAQLPGAVAHVGELLRQARVFTLPSRMDNLPMALLEAMANGVPVVATRVGGVPEAVGEGPEAAGTLVPPGDAPALAHALRPYLVDPAWAQEVGLRARRRAEERFGAARMAQGWLGVYRSLVAPGKADQAIP